MKLFSRFYFKWLKKKEVSMKSTSPPVSDRTSGSSELRYTEYEESFYQNKDKDKTRVYTNFSDFRDKGQKKRK